MFLLLNITLLTRDWGKNIYLSNLGSKVYLDGSEYFSDKKIEIKYYSFEAFNYDQINGNFISNLSIIDYLFNCGNSNLKNEIN